MCFNSSLALEDSRIHQCHAPGPASSKTVEDTRPGSQRLFARIGKLGFLPWGADALIPVVTEGWRRVQPGREVRVSVDRCPVVWTPAARLPVS